jgi:hypothetical protein
VPWAPSALPARSRDARPSRERPSTTIGQTRARKLDASRFATLRALLSAHTLQDGIEVARQLGQTFQGEGRHFGGGGRHLRLALPRAPLARESFLCGRGRGRRWGRVWQSLAWIPRERDERRGPGGEGVDERADGRREKLALRIDEREARLGLELAGEDAHELARFEQAVQDEAREHRDAQAAQSEGALEQDLVGEEAAFDVDFASGLDRPVCVRQRCSRRSRLERGTPCFARYSGEATAIKGSRASVRATSPGSSARDARSAAS